MGFSHSKEKFAYLCTTEKFKHWNENFQALSLSLKHISKLYHIFCKVDVDNSGQIALSELLAHIDLSRTKFTERIFSIFDDDSSGEIDFHEFVLALWNYCTLTKATLDMFAFDLYDKDGSGVLSPQEIIGMLQDIYGKKGVKTNFLAKNIIHELSELEKKDTDDVLDFDQFRVFTRNHQAMLFPAFQMQSALQRSVLGVNFWEANANRRLLVAQEKYVTIRKYLELNVYNKDVIVTANLLNSSDTYVASNINPANSVTKTIMQLTGIKAQRKWSNASQQSTNSSNNVEVFQRELTPPRGASRALTPPRTNPLLYNNTIEIHHSNHQTILPRLPFDITTANINHNNTNHNNTTTNNNSKHNNHKHITMNSTKGLWERGFFSVKNINKIAIGNKEHNNSNNSIDGSKSKLTMEAISNIKEISPLQAWVKQLPSSDTSTTTITTNNIKKPHQQAHQHTYTTTNTTTKKQHQQHQYKNNSKEYTLVEEFNDYDHNNDTTSHSESANKHLFRRNTSTGITNNNNTNHHNNHHNNNHSHIHSHLDTLYENNPIQPTTSHSNIHRRHTVSHHIT